MTVRDNRTQASARTPGAEDDPTSTTVRDRVLGPTQCGISDVATKGHEGRCILLCARRLHQRKASTPTGLSSSGGGAEGSLIGTTIHSGFSPAHHRNRVSQL